MINSPAVKTALCVLSINHRSAHIAFAGSDTTAVTMFVPVRQPRPQGQKTEGSLNVSHQGCSDLFKVSRFIYNVPVIAAQK